ncbi:MAG: alanine racemase [bacterium]|nr:alanine racemase [bacterium]
MKESYVLVDTEVLQSNIDNIITKYNDYKYYIGVVKGNAYGHGMDSVKYMVKSGINYLAVSTLEEALKVRSLVDTNILCLQPIDIKELQLASKNNITITISSYDYYKKVIDTNLNLTVHLKIDSGMNRLGLNKKNEINEIYSSLIKSKNIHLEGIYTHLATVGIIDKKWDNQVDKFLDLTSDIDLNKIKIIHLYSTNSLVIHPKLKFANGVRIGILMYGISPREINYSGIKGKIRKIKKDYLVKKYDISFVNEVYGIKVKPCLKLISKVIEIKDVEKNEYIGYGLKYKTESNCKVAIVPIGYADGLSLNNSGRFVTINDKKYKIVGSINMKMITILVDDDVKLEDEVIVIGEDARSISAYTKTTPQNLFTTIPSNIPRVYK